MTEPRPAADLKGLARERDLPTHNIRPPRRWLRLVVPAVLILGFCVILASSLTDWLRSKVEVTVLRPSPALTGTGAIAGTVAVQAAGWVEPDPFPIRVAALSTGVVREMLVQEGDIVHKDDPVALLVNEDAHLGCDGAQAMLARAKAEQQKAAAEARAAKTNFDTPIALIESEAVAQAELDGKKAERTSREQAAIEAAARLRLAEAELEVQRFLQQEGVDGPFQVKIAEAKVSEARASAEVLKADAALAVAEMNKAEAKVARVQRERELRTEDKLRLEGADAALAIANASVAQVQVTCDEAILRLARMTVKAPADGIVLQRLAITGSVVGGIDAVCSLYDPKHVRIRVDVPQGDLAKLSAGQKGQIETEARPGKPYLGEVIRIVRTADIQKVTMQVHVRVIEPDELLRPEMLVQVKLYAPVSTDSRAASGPASLGDPSRVRIPNRLLVNGSTVWVVDGITRRARLQTVTVGSRIGEEVEVTTGLDLSSKLIDQGRERLQAGDALRIKEQE